MFEIALKKRNTMDQAIVHVTIPKVCVRPNAFRKQNVSKIDRVEMCVGFRDSYLSNPKDRSKSVVNIGERTVRVCVVSLFVCPGRGKIHSKAAKPLVLKPSDRSEQVHGGHKSRLAVRPNVRCLSSPLL